jgi:hypothetical protein
MDVLIEMEFISRKERVLEMLRSKYQWVQKRTREGAKDYFVEQWNEFFEAFNNYFDSEESFHNELRRMASIKKKVSPSIPQINNMEDVHSSRPYNPLNRKAKEAFRDDWNLKQQIKWMDHY